MIEQAIDYARSQGKQVPGSSAPLTSAQRRASAEPDARAPRIVVMENRAGPVADASGALLELEARQTGVRQRLVPWTPTGLPWRHGMELNLEPDPPHPTLMYRVGATVEDSAWTAIRPEDPATIRDTAWVDA